MRSVAHPHPDLLVAGASARAVAFSALRAGLRVATADLFGDRDLAAVASVMVIDDWPSDIERWAASFPSDVTFVYAGGLENHPELLSQIQRRRPVAGVCGEPLRIVRHPQTLHELLTRQSVPVARLASEGASLQGRWLIKPRHGGGGRGVRFFDPENETPGRDEYVQEFIEGTPGSAAFLASDNGEVELIGICESLLAGDGEVHRFEYHGSVIRTDWSRPPMEHAGRVLAAAGLRGLFGVDFIRRGDNECVVIEVNPRPTASMELYELASGRSLVAEHLAAFGMGGAMPQIARRVSQPAVIGKRIVYAPRDLTCGLDVVPSLAEIESGRYSLADLPRAGTVIPRSAPICTVIARAEDPDACRWSLDRLTREVLEACPATSREVRS